MWFIFVNILNQNLNHILNHYMQGGFKRHQLLQLPNHTSLDTHIIKHFLDFLAHVLKHHHSMFHH